MAHDDLVAHFEAYSAWRSRLSDNVGDFRNWLNEQELNDAQTELRIQHLLDRLRDDKLNVAFVAEFSRGKSELINAIFFADYGQRLLPSSAGRTTMCPTELMYEEGREPCIRLLPIETRAADTTTTEYKRYLDEWTDRSARHRVSRSHGRRLPAGEPDQAGQPGGSRTLWAV